MQIIYTESAPSAIGPYSQGTKSGRLLFTSGQIALDPETGVLRGEDVAEQTRQVMKNLEAVLSAGGADFSMVVKTTCYLKDVARDFGAFNEEYAKALGENKPARSCVGVAELPKGALVEVEMIAILP